MTYIIRSVSLTNFLSHENTTIRFPMGSVALIGENGAGKTSVFEAIYYALTGAGWRGKASDLVQIGKQRATIELQLYDPVSGSQAVARVVIERRREGATSSYQLKVDGKVVATTAAAYKEEIARLLGLHGVTDYRSFIESAVIIRQGGLAEIASILSSEESKRLKELVESAIGVPQLEKAAEAIRSHTIRAVRSDGSVVMAFDVGPRRRAEVLKAIQAARDLKRARLAEAKGLEEKLSQAEGALSSLTAELEALAKASDEACRAASALDLVRRQLAEAERELEEERARLARLTEQVNTLRRRAEALSSLASLASLAPLVDELTSLNSRAASLGQEISALRPIAEAYVELKTNEEAHKEYEGLRQRVEALRSKRGELAESIRAVEAMIEQVRRLKASEAQALEKAREALGAGPDCDEGCLRRRLEETEAEAERLRQRVQELIVSSEAAERRLAELEEIMRLLRAGGQQARCPVCGSPLTQGKVNELMAQLSEEASRLSAASKASREEAQALSSKLSGLASSLDVAKAALASLSQLRSSGQDLDELLRRRDQLRSSLESVEKELSDAEARMRGLERANAAYLAAASRLDAAGFRPPERAKDVVERLRALEGDLEQVRDRAIALERELVEKTSTRDLAQAIARVKEATEAQAQLKAIQDSLNAELAEVAEAQARVRDLEAKAEGLRAQVTELEPKAKECEELRRRENELRSKRDAAINEVASLRSRIEQAKAEAARAGDEEAALTKALDKLDAALGALASIERLEKALYRRALVSLENEMNEIFRLFGLDYARIEVHETGDSFYFRVVDRQGVERPISTLSGGEQMVVSLAYVLALSRIMQSRVGFLLLDEPTDMLDDDRRRALVDILGRLTEEGGLPQLIVITHHSDVIDKVDKVCVVEKSQTGVSSVSCNEGVGG